VKVTDELLFLQFSSVILYHTLYKFHNKEFQVDTV